MSEELKRRAFIVALARVMESDYGRAALRTILDECRVFGSVATNHGLALREEHAVWYRAGRQDLGHFLMDSLATASPAGFRTMNEEAHARKLLEQDKGNRKRKQEEDSDAV